MEKIWSILWPTVCVVLAAPWLSWAVETPPDAQSLLARGAQGTWWTEPGPPHQSFWVLTKPPIGNAPSSGPILGQATRMRELWEKVTSLGGALALTESRYDRWVRIASVYFDQGPLKERSDISPYRFLFVVNQRTHAAAIAHEWVHVRDGVEGVRHWDSSIEGANWARTWASIGQSEINAFLEGSWPHRWETDTWLTWQSYEEALYFAYWKLKARLGQCWLSPTLTHALQVCSALFGLFLHLFFWAGLCLAILESLRSLGAFKRRPRLTPSLG